MTKRSVTNSGTLQNTSNPKTAIFALTRKGAELAGRLSAKIPDSTCFSNYRYALPGMSVFTHISDVFQSAWREYDWIICIMGCGIAVRMVAPLLEGKTLDPAVVVLDQDGRFAVSLVSGHIGGANELAGKVASVTGGQPVITTASDLQDKPAVDLAAKKSGLLIENMGMLSRIQAAILDEEPLWIYDPYRLLIRHFPENHGLQVVGEQWEIDDLRQSLGIWVSELLGIRGLRCLKLRPANLVVGIGCNRGTASEEIIGFVNKKFKESKLTPLSIRNFASIDLKADESGLLDAVKIFERPIEFCTRKEIENICVPNPSETVARHVGVESVCEASALWSAGTRELLVSKRKAGNCTMAIARVNSL